MHEMPGPESPERWVRLPLQTEGSIFEGKSVAVLGLGNSAFEVANAAADYANYVHIWPTRDYGSWENALQLLA